MLYELVVWAWYDENRKKAFFCLTLLHSPSVYFMPTGTWMPPTLILKDTDIISKTLPLCSIFVL